MKPTVLFYKICNKIVRRTAWYNQDYWHGVTKFWNMRQFGLDIVNLGSGAALHAFNYYNTNVKGRNWALSPQSLLHDYNILRNYFSYLREGAVVVVTVCPFSCLFSKYSKEQNLKYYTILHPATIIDFDDRERTRALLFRDNPFKQAPLMCIRRTLIGVLKKVKRGFPRKRQNLQTSADNILAGWKRQFGIFNLTAPMAEQHRQQFLSRRETLETIVSFCKERDLKPVIVIPPMHHTLHKQFPPEFIHNYIESFVAGIDAPVYNYMKAPVSDQDRNFRTALFLNENGAKIFTAQLLKDLGLCNN